MKNILQKNALIAFSSLLLICCNNRKDKTTEAPTGDTAITKQETTITQQSVPKEEKANTDGNQQNYSYEPSVSVITGTIITEMFYGPPGYGENPKTDKKEEVYLLIPEKPVTVLAPTTKTDDADLETVNNASKIQLIWPDNIDMTKLKSKKVRLTGTFFAPHTSHHRTDVLLDVQQLDEL